MNFPLLGLFGGRFDPIHNGHLSVLEQLIETLPFETIQLIPCYQPPHRGNTAADSLDRLEMIKRAVSNRPIFSVSDIEIEKKEISYTIYTLRSLRNSFSKYALCFILSTDAFSNFNLWYRYTEFLSYCHLIVINRANYHLPSAKWLEILLRNRTEDPKDLKKFLSGKIFFQQLSDYPISATEIRNCLAKGNYSDIQSMFPKGVIEYIKRHNLYK
ncbi:nicotinate-nucleotide adenylyltransferase [Coxiella endosymbiont of Amblyomma sculptum]|uniref:nicotinate-nucleotide adenylyltransferase n=1 Tax=Coxiella endosymbiont of Amblyomma sculptum TaxID=2487929 RepID=UPI00132F0B4C|nr:nicotinate-nucleotide adenylyltransferase [Coxiella endosymbiont of Amblyomma sculptum]QHG92625.1 nicotinate-nucleotide adenylyltransferase [Coxiella endosymbiont of Amblyomma sculptum]